MVGAGKDWRGDGLDSPTDVGSGLWVPGVDYVAGWQVARAAADRLNRALLGVGFELSGVRAVAATDEDGRGVVRLAGRPADVDRLAMLLESRGQGDGGAR
ncbi:hypothetical protein [Streptomyces fumanus]|uniref:Uncharacterized protein n=1 Tax=Streptomyces fumanus TaxID=67302 RepID=A0A919A6K3_9ACTN|nr:hypothetical protein [Streptomyces fumanus]GHE90562.1 hypothetical protein GCM10018772_13090 [Streptomyces fumanus]